MLRLDRAERNMGFQKLGLVAKELRGVRVEFGQREKLPLRERCPLCILTH